MKNLTTNELVERLMWRYAVKKFDATKKLSKDQWTALEEALVLTPSSYGLQPWKFIVIENTEMKKKLRAVSWNQSQVEDCSHLVVFTVCEQVDESYITKFIEETASVRGVPVATLDTYKKMMLGDLVQGPRSKIITEWAIRQTYIALGNLMTCAAVLGIDTCPLEGIEPHKYDEVLSLQGTGYKTAVACAVGFRSEEDKYASAKKVRFSKSRVVATV